MFETPNIAADTARCRPAASGNERPWLRTRFRFNARPAGLPLVLLLLALSTLFLFGGDREYFYRNGHHAKSSARFLTLAENLSLRHNLLIFHYQSQDAAGNLQYPSLYNRFPLGGYALAKLAILPFGDTDFRAQIYAARALMLLLFSAAAVLAYAALARITGSRWDALTATLLAFSSYYLLYYADMILNETTIDLFAVMLAFHGMVVFVQEGRFRQLVIKSCVALLLGWHVYAFLLPFIVFGLATELLKAHNTFSTPSLRIMSTKYCMTTLLRSRYLLLGITTLLFGIAVLGFNFSNEYLALNKEKPFRELPSVVSALRRTGLDEAYRALISARLEPQVFWPNQFYRVAVMTLPYAANPYEIEQHIPKYQYRYYPVIAFGVLAVGFCLAGLAWAGIRRRPGSLLLLTTLIFSGFCWAAPLQYNVALHDFESVFYIGIPLTLFALTLRYLRRLSRIRLAPYLAVAALAVFAVSASEITGLGQSRKEIAVMAAEMADSAAIRELADDSAAIYAPQNFTTVEHSNVHWNLPYYLSGKTLIFNDDHWPRKPQQPGDYLLLFTGDDNPALLTPESRYIFLYDWALYDEWHRPENLGVPIINADWQVYLRDGHLIYASQECANRNDSFFLHFIPQVAANLPSGRQEYGYDNRDFAFQLAGVTLTEGTCLITRPLPDYDIRAIRTGQYTADGQIWHGEYRLP